eukprot:scaffold13619_cov33-Phaeocystis_antarctica.AAC.1
MSLHQTKSPAAAQPPAVAVPPPAVAVPPPAVAVPPKPRRRAPELRYSPLELLSAAASQLLDQRLPLFPPMSLQTLSQPAAPPPGPLLDPRLPPFPPM